jgi:hypothetical protein
VILLINCYYNTTIIVIVHMCCTDNLWSDAWTTMSSHLLWLMDTYIHILDCDYVHMSYIHFSCAVYYLYMYMNRISSALHGYVRCWWLVLMISWVFNGYFDYHCISIYEFVINTKVFVLYTLTLALEGENYYHEIVLGILIVYDILYSQLYTSYIQYI